MARTELVDSVDCDSIIHIRVDHDHMQKNMSFSTYVLEQMISDTYDGATVSKDYNAYGLLTDIWIRFTDPKDAVHFKLRNYFN